MEQGTCELSTDQPDYVTDAWIAHGTAGRNLSNLHVVLLLVVVTLSPILQPLASGSRRIHVQVNILVGGFSVVAP